MGHRETFREYTSDVLATLVASLLIAAPPTQLVHGDDGWTLLRHGQPYFVKGAGAHTELLPALVAAGANSVRTWGVGGDAEAYLDRCHALGLTVTVGIWLRKDPDFSYDDKAARLGQVQHAVDVVRRLRDHPAVLMWAVGNEMELGAPDERVWQDVERIAKVFKRWDDRPVMTVVADMWPEKMDAILRHCPSIDLLGVNSYDGLPTLETRMTRWTKPYLVTEYHYAGLGRPDPTTGLLDEPSTTRKAASLRELYQNTILGHPGRVLGGYFFHWSLSSTQTSGLYSCFLKTGEKTESVDALTELWGGPVPANRAPSVRGAVEISAGEWQIDAWDPDGDALSAELEVIRERTEERFVGDFEQTVPVVLKQPTGLRFKLPALPAGVYRAVVVIRDGKGGAAVWNTDFRARSK